MVTFGTFSKFQYSYVKVFWWWKFRAILSKTMCSQLLLGGLIHEGLGSFHTGKEVGKIFFVLDSGTIFAIVKFSGESSSTDFLGKGLAVKRCWEISIFSMSKVFDWTNIVSTLLLLEILFVLISLLILITAFMMLFGIFCIFLN